MDKNRVIRIIKMLGIIAIIAVVIVLIFHVIQKVGKNLETSNLKSNMLQIQAKCRVLNDKADMNNKVDEERKGNKLSSFKDEEVKNSTENTDNAENKENSENQESTENKESTENAENSINAENESSENTSNNDVEKTVDEIIREFKKLNIVSESDYDKFYVLEDADLESLGLNFKNEKNARYIINYDTREVVITCGYQGQYLLSQMGLKD